jgi:hypothetical protein
MEKIKIENNINKIMKEIKNTNPREDWSDDR